MRVPLSRAAFSLCVRGGPVGKETSLGERACHQDSVGSPRCAGPRPAPAASVTFRPPPLPREQSAPTLAETRFPCLKPRSDSEFPEALPPVQVQVLFKDRAALGRCPAKTGVSSQRTLPLGSADPWWWVGRRRAPAQRSRSAWPQLANADGAVQNGNLRSRPASGQVAGKGPKSPRGVAEEAFGRRLQVMRWVGSAWVSWKMTKMLGWWRQSTALS